MGIADRDYSRQQPRRGGPGFRGVGAGGLGSGGLGGRLPLLSANTWLIIINCAVFFLSGLVPMLRAWSLDLGHFSTAHFFKLEVWRLVSFQFLHADLMHLLFNMIGLFFFGSMVEQQLGRRTYLAFYLVCGIAGGLLYLTLNLAGNIAAGMGLSVPGLLINDASTPLIGASAGVFGVILACARLSPNSQVFIFGVIPMRLRTFAFGYVGLAAFNLLALGNNAGGDAAHLGGAIAGWFFVRNAHLLTDFFDVFNDSRKGTGKGGRPGGRAAPRQDEIDRILAKVQRDGLHSLSDREKKKLREASDARRAS
ncbi:MAG: rhomboid family intramembrane serine protease [Planctomycetota bacterium]